MSTERNHGDLNERIPERLRESVERILEHHRLMRDAVAAGELESAAAVEPERREALQAGLDVADSEEERAFMAELARQLLQTDQDLIAALSERRRKMETELGELRKGQQGAHAYARHAHPA